MESVGNPEKYKRIVRTVLNFKDGRKLENVWNVEGVFKKYKKEIKTVVVEEIPRDCFVNKLDEFKASEVDNILTATLFYQAAGRNVYIGKTIVLKNGKKISYFIDGSTKTFTGGQK